MGTASDVYSLGVVLYELLAGQRPHQLSGRGPVELARVLLHEQPARPSAAVTEAMARGVGATVARLRGALEGDLDTIVFEALRKEPERRYFSAAALAEDVRRHLAGLPVLARPGHPRVPRARRSLLARALLPHGLQGRATVRALSRSKEGHLMKQARTWKRTTLATGLALLGATSSLLAADGRPPATPPEMVATYDALADAILGGLKAEKRLVHAILATTYAHAQAELGRSRQALKANDAAAARSSIENLAAAVGQIGTEGDNAVAGVRKRLLEGGHHANAEGEAQGTFDEGYVVVSKAAKKAFLDSAQALARLAAAPKAEALEAEWQKVEAAWKQHVASAK